MYILTVNPIEGLRMTVFPNLQTWKDEDILTHTEGLPKMRKHPTHLRLPIHQSKEARKIFINSIKTQWTTHSLDRVIVVIFKRYLMSIIDAKKIVPHEFLEVYRTLRLVIEDLQLEKKLEQCVIAGPDMLTRITAIILSRCHWDDVYMIYEDFFLKLVREAIEVVARSRPRSEPIERVITRSLMKRPIAIIMLDMMAVICQADALNEDDVKRIPLDHEVLERFVTNRCTAEVIQELEALLLYV